jgi:hypothetical protein
MAYEVTRVVSILSLGFHSAFTAYQGSANEKHIQITTIAITDMVITKYLVLPFILLRFQGQKMTIISF